MKFKTFFYRAACSFLFTCVTLCTAAQDIYFCGEKIPLSDKFVADKLMNIIKKHINYINLPSLKVKINQYMPEVERFLLETNLPQDLKYLAIVESGFKTDVTSSAGAAGFWQLMPKTARQWNLTVNETIDERTDFNKSTLAACRELASNYLNIRKTYGISSWVLTAAAYNFGIGNIGNAIKREGKNYFEMNLNKETAEYVYKIIAVKELFEFPELYMKGFDYNIFTTTKTNKLKNANEKDNTEKMNLGGMKVKVNENDGEHPSNLNKKLNPVINEDPSKVKFVNAQISGKYKNFKDGNVVSILLQDELQVINRFNGKGTTVQGRGWIIDGRVAVDLGFDHAVILYDKNKEKGVALKSLKNKEQVILKVITANK